MLLVTLRLRLHWRERYWIQPNTRASSYGPSMNTEYFYPNLLKLNSTIIGLENPESPDTHLGPGANIWNLLVNLSSQTRPELGQGLVATLTCIVPCQDA